MERQRDAALASSGVAFSFGNNLDGQAGIGTYSVTSLTPKPIVTTNSKAAARVTPQIMDRTERGCPGYSHSIVPGGLLVTS